MNQSKDPYISRAFAEGKIDRKLRMLEGVARILSDNYNVSVVFSPDGECKTTPEIMTLPYDKGVDEALILGLCGHETGHLKHTDFGIARVIARHKKVHNRPLLYVIFNALEDVRIEMEMEKAYPGFKEMFQRLLPYIQEKKQPMLECEQKIKDLFEEGKSTTEIEELIQEDCDNEIKKLEKVLKEAGFSSKYIEFEVEQLKRAQEAPLCEIQKILDVVYLMLRKYDHTWYPAETIDFVEKEVLDTAKEVYKCKDSNETLDVAVKVYNILTDNESKIRKRAKQEEEDGTGKQPAPNQDEGKGNGSSKDKDSKKKGRKGEGEESKGDEGSSKEAEEAEGKGQDQESDEEGEQQKGGSDSIRVRPGQVLQVGSKVSHLKYPQKRGVVKVIDNKSREIVVEWEV
jgi:hypothetical protein